MDDIISVISIIVSVFAIIVTLVFNYWLRKWQYRKEYAIHNVERIYVPLLTEFNHDLLFFDNFLEKPEQLIWDFPKLKEVKESGLFEFIRAHNKRLFENLDHFYKEILPKFSELDEMRKDTQNRIGSLTTSHLESVSDEAAKIFAHEIASDFSSKIFPDLLRNREKKLVETYGKGFARRLGPAGGILFTVSDEVAKKLIKITQSETRKLVNFYKELQTEVNEVLKGNIMPMLLEYIGKPI